MTLLRCQGLCGRRLRDLTLDVGGGEIVGVVGPRRGGKTELLRLAAGLARPRAGTVRISGHLVGCREARRLAGYAADPPLAPRELTGEEWLRYLAAHRAASPAERERLVRDALELAGLGRWASRLIAVYSRGAAQQLSVAAAALGDPDVLLLDEPLAGLDPDAAAHLRAGLARLAGGGSALVIVSNDLTGLERLTTRTLVLQAGRLVADLATARLLGERVAELSLNGGALRAAAWLLARFPGALRTGDGVAVPLVDGLTVEQVLTACRSQRIAVAASRVRYRVLEDLLHDPTHAPR